jgi:SAM-dependent methyltransferase
MHLLAIDISPKMLERAAKKAAAYPGTIELQEMDVRDLKFPDATFDTVLTVCTFCPGFHRDDETGVSALLRRGEVRERGRSQRGSG